MQWRIDSGSARITGIVDMAFHVGGGMECMLCIAEWELIHFAHSNSRPMSQFNPLKEIHYSALGAGTR